MRTLDRARNRAIDPLPPADIQFHKGELPVEQLLALLQHADAVIGGISSIVPASIAAKVPAWIICGGQGRYNWPERITTNAWTCPASPSAVPDGSAADHETAHL
ncbi:hypothetical protein ACNUI4_32355 [Pseudomonas aeruginosa]